MFVWDGDSVASFLCLSRKKKKILKEQRKQRERVELKMDLPGVSIADDGDTSMFSLRSIHRTPVREGAPGLGQGLVCVSCHLCHMCDSNLCCSY